MQPCIEQACPCRTLKLVPATTVVRDYLVDLLSELISNEIDLQKLRIGFGTKLGPNKKSSRNTFTT